MACACGKNRAKAVAASKGKQFVYDFTAPNSPEGTVPTTYSTALEAKRAVMQHGGGVVRTRTVVTAA